jgi:hypothetical protein
VYCKDLQTPVEIAEVKYYHKYSNHLVELKDFRDLTPEEIADLESKGGLNVYQRTR